MRRDDSGVGAILVLIAMGALLAGIAVALIFAEVMVERSRLDSAADLAALAAAARAADPVAACQAAADGAALNDASVDSCVVVGRDVTIRVSRPAPPGLTRLATSLGLPAPRIHSISRAGPPRSSQQRGYDQVQESTSAFLVQRFVAVTAFGRLDARRTPGQAFARGHGVPCCRQPDRRSTVAALGKASASRGTVVNDDRASPGVGMILG
jgi:secretion/DNA translocation related TadE-like protein